MVRLRDSYRDEFVPKLMARFGYANRHQVPKLVKVVVNMGVGDAVGDEKILEDAIEELSLITGQRPVKTVARRSVSEFKLREGNPVGCRVTLRGPKMYEFLDRLINVTLPSIRDFRGVSPNSFDGSGNYNLGLQEQIVFPEIDIDKVKRTQGMDIAIVTSAGTDEEAKELLAMFGMPFSGRK
jgi:large subunit ribosomal protein L5